MWIEIPSFEFSNVLYITPTHTSSMQELIIQGMQQKLEIIFHNLQNIWLLLLIGLDILTTILTKVDVPYLWIWLLYLVSINWACRLS